MNKPLLSILIPTVVGREEELSILKAHLECNQFYNRWVAVSEQNGCSIHTDHDLLSPVEIIVCKDDKTLAIGEKREMLYQLARGEYSIQIDDDDSLSDDAIGIFLKEIQNKPQCITFRENCSINGVYHSSNHSIKYEKWQALFDGFHFVRCPFYKDVIRTDIARSVPFPKIRWNEDEQWSMALKPHLTSEIHIDQELYFYQYTSTDHNTRYGITETNL